MRWKKFWTDELTDGTQTSRFSSLSFISVVSFNSHVGVGETSGRGEGFIEITGERVERQLKLERESRRVAN